MFSLEEIDDQIWVFNRAADDLEEKAAGMTHLMTQSALRCHAGGLREAAQSLQRMIANEIEFQAREALR